MAKHTPGPWKIGRMPNPNSRGYSHVTYGLLNIRVETAEEADANARLIAAAPELLAQLEALVGQLEASGLVAPALIPPNVRAAIAKARGRA